MNFNDQVKRIYIPEDQSKSVLKITSTEIESTDVDDDGTELVEYKALWRKPITVSFDPNGAAGSVPDVHTRYGLDWQTPFILVDTDHNPETDEDPLLNHPSNYEFVGWSLDPSASPDKTGMDNQFVFDEGVDGPLDKDDFTMYAIWKELAGYDDEQITVYEKDGSVIDDRFTIPYNGQYTFYVASGGGGGAAWYRTHHHAHKEGQGGYGYWGTFKINLNKGDVVVIPRIGGGGSGDTHQGGNGGSNGPARGFSGGDTELYVAGKFHVKMTGGGGGQAHNGTSDGGPGGLTMSEGVAVTHERMRRWILPRVFGIPYAEELLAWANEALRNDTKKLPTANTSSYKNGKTFKTFWTSYLQTMTKFLNDYKGSAALTYGAPDIFEIVKKYRPAWSKYNSPDDAYKKNTNIISLNTTSVKYTDASGTTHNVWPKNASGEYSCAFAGKPLDEIRDMVINCFGKDSNDGNRGTASYKSASSGIHGCVKIVASIIDKCTVTWNGNGGNTPTPSSTQVENTFAIKTAISTLPTTTRTGYTQNKWWTASSGGSEVTLNTVVNNSLTAYAHWTPKTYTITWNPNGGTVDPTSWSVTYGTTLGSHGALPVPTKDGFEFGNWWTAAEGGTQITTSTPVPSEHTTYYAHWNDIGFTTIELTANTPLTTVAFPPGEYGIIMAGSGIKSPNGTCASGSAFYAKFNIPSAVEMTYGITLGSPTFSDKLEPGETPYDGNGKDYVACMCSTSGLTSSGSTNDMPNRQLFGDGWGSIEIGPIDWPDIVIEGYVITHDRFDASDANNLIPDLPSIYTHVALIKNGSKGLTDRPSNLIFAGDAYLPAINLNYGASPTAAVAGGPYLKIYKIA